MAGRLLVTGGAGFIGCNLVRHLLERTGHRVTVLDKLTYAGSLDNLADARTHPRFAFVHGDIADEERVRGVFADARPTAVLNLAAESHVDRSIDSPRPFLSTNVLGTFVLLEAARRLLRDLPRAEAETFRFLHVSTDEVFGSLGPEGRFTEKTPYRPNSPYAATKASADHLVRAYHRTYGLPTLLTNCSNNFGPYQFPEKLVPLTILNALEGRELPIYGDGQNVRDWLFVEDHCAGIAAVLEGGRPGEGYNLGGESERTNLEVVETICDTLERVRPAASNLRLGERGVDDYRSLRRFVADRKGHDRRYAIDPSKVRRDLGWRPRHTFGTAMEATVRWYLDHLDWCASMQRKARYDRERLGQKELEP